jgi:hypothetical protein
VAENRPRELISRKPYYILRAAFLNQCGLLDFHEEPGGVDKITNIMTFQKAKI